MKKIFLALLAFPLVFQAQKGMPSGESPFLWENATVYFMFTDRFHNGTAANDTNFNRTGQAAPLRGFMGGDLRGIIKKLDEGYFDNLGVTALWMTPIVEQIHGGTGLTYGFHGYWTRDWTKLDPNFGTEADLAELVDKAHARGIRIILDAVINHTGPVTADDPVWPEDWVRTEPQCDYQTYQTNITCTLVKNLPDIKTESEANVALPHALVAKWKAEGRYEQEMKELNAFFKRTGYPRAPKYYIMKWLTDYVAEFGIDAYRADAVKHTEEQVWAAFKTQCQYAFDQWKKNNRQKVLDNKTFYLIADVHHYGISSGRDFDFGDRKVDYFSHGFNAMINFEFKSNAKESYESIFSRYSDRLNGILEGKSIVNDLSSHDEPFDAERSKSAESAVKLLLSPGIAQIYYGDETARRLDEQAEGDAKLESFMNWESLSDRSTQTNLQHWQKIGQFRKKHPAVGAGIHQQISASPYVFSRGMKLPSYIDRVVVGLDLPKGKKEIPVGTVFKEGTILRDFYSGQQTTVINGKAQIDSPYTIALLEFRK